MVMGKARMLVPLLLLLIIHSHPTLSLTKCKKHELDALLRFKHSFTQDRLGLLSTWVGDDCCRWRGIGCDNLNGNVIKLSLTNTQDYTKALVSSEISSALLELNFLTHLDLSLNDFNGSRIPTFVGSMTTLRYLNLGYARLSGPIPPQIGNLTNLVHLHLSYVDSSRLYRGERLEWASGLSKLQYLDMSGVYMAQTNHTLQVLFTLPSLSSLLLAACGLNNTHLSEQWISNTTSTLQHLDLSWNHFEGHVPLWLTNMRQLEYLDLGYNKFNGIQPLQLGQLTNLSYLDLSSNEFQGSIPESLTQLSALKHLDLSYNRLSRLMPNSIGRLTEIEHLDISSNSIQGTISDMGNLSKLSYLNMNFNNIKLNFSTDWRPPFHQLQLLEINSCEMNIPFPQWLRNQTQMETLDLSYTGISGELPQWLGNFTNLQYLQLAGNKLTGSLPHHFTCDGCNLEWLDLQENMLSGLVPRWLKHLKTTSVVDLSQNMLSGKIFEGENASSLLNAGSPLFILDLSDNILSGEIHVMGTYPHAYSGLSLNFLSLRGNDFSGYISSKLCQFSELAILELAHNRLMGKIPRCLGSLMFQSGSGYFSNSGLEMQEIIKGTPENLGGTVGAHSMIDFSCNDLVGTIPEELTNITKLMQLNLSNNHLTGGIPNDVGNLGLLESLDLSNNNLSGGIPQSLSDIRWLSFLNLSNNNLEGPIPSGSQLQTLDDPSIYDGNSGLCGFPLAKCSKSSPSTSLTDVGHGSEEEDDAKDKLDKLWLYLAVMSGVATGFWGVIGTLVVKKSWRHAYFRYVEKTGHEIYVPFKVRMNRFWRAETENSE